MAKRYFVEVTDMEWKALSWKYVDPHQHIDDLVTERIKSAMKEIADNEIKRRLSDPNWTEPIPADRTMIFNSLILKSAKQLRDEDTARMIIMVQNPDVGGTIPVPEPTSVKP